MTHRLNTLDPVVAKRWIGEYESNEQELVSYAARCREGRKPFVERRGSIVERAEAAGLNRKAFLDEIKERSLKRKINSLSADDDQEEVEQKKLLKLALDGLPLGDWAVATTAPTEGSRGKKNAAVPGVTPDDTQLTLAEAKEILARPKGKGRPSASKLAQRAAAQKIVDAAAQIEEEIANKAPKDGASGEQAAAIAEMMEAQDAESDDNVTDLRPKFLQKPSEAA